MNKPLQTLKADAAAVTAALEHAIGAIPPVWPLASSVAVNPFLGQASQNLARTGALLARVAGLKVTMPRDWYAARIASGDISDDDLEAARRASQEPKRPADVAAIKSALRCPSPQPEPVPTVADLAGAVSATDWAGLVAERFGAWAAGYFDEGQALWAAPRRDGAYTAWRTTATRDLTPEIAGLSGFCAFVDRAPQAGRDAIERAVDRLGLAADELPTYFHRLLMTLGGWAQIGRYRAWQADLSGGTDTTLADLLAIRLVFEEALYEQFGATLEIQWQAARAAHARPVTPDADQVIDAILQDAAERAAQRNLSSVMQEPAAPPASARPALQAAFCIDVRSEVFRRALESLSPEVSTIGFAGFFGLATSHRGFASDAQELRGPVLLNPGVHSCSGGDHDRAADLTRRYAARAKRAWGRFKLAAVSSFAFVEATGPLYAAKLVRDAFGAAGKPAGKDPLPRLEPDPDLETRIKTAATVLRAMSLTANFAPVVLLAGHGARVANNPHASALQCGACGGYSGEVNARLLAALLNDGEVRQGLTRDGIEIPADTLFVAGLHDTVTDEVTLFDGDHPSPGHSEQVSRLIGWLASAARDARRERALRLPRAGDGAAAAARARDWAEIRPEWALAGCRAFVAAPRRRTSGRDLQGRVFLHEYDWRQDKGFPVLELIMTAPVVVASWISLQYYGSVVAPSAFGAGNKLLHNVVGGFGVVEGNGGPLRAGLPWQSVHDGEKLVHEPLRLSVMIEAPVEAMSEILVRHDGVRALFDNGWLHLFALDDEGKMARRYTGGLQWTPCADTAAAAPSDPGVAMAG